MTADSDDERGDRGIHRASFIGTILSLGFVLAAAAIVLFAWLAGEVFEGDTRAFDDAIRAFVHSYATETLTGVVKWISFIGKAVFLTPLTVLVALAFLFFRQRRSALLLIITMLGAAILNYILKITFQRVRPVPFFDLPTPLSFSFPSGHALASACFCGISAWLIASKLQSDVRKGITWSAAIVITILIGLSRIYLGVHFPSDVIAGYIAAFVWLSAVLAANKLFDKDRRDEH